VPQAARSTPAAGEAARAGGEFFAFPAEANHRRYEALRAFLYEGRSGAEAAARVGWSIETLRSAVRDFRGGKTGFFATPRPGPVSAPAKEAAREAIVELRRQGLSAIEISEALEKTTTPLNRTGVAEVLREEGLPRLWPRPLDARHPLGRNALARAEAIDWGLFPARSESRVAGLLLAVPELVALDVPGIVAQAGYPSTKMISAMSYVLSLVALKLTGMRRVSHVDDLAADPGAALFASLVALPKTTALTTYSYRLSHERQLALLSALGRKMLETDLIADRAGDLDLDFHSIMHWGEDVALEKHYVPSRSQRSRSVLSFFAQDHSTHNLIYANADLTKAAQAREVVVFCEHWKSLTGRYPELVVMDQKVTTHAVLAELDEMGVGFITLRMRSPSLVRHIESIRASEWKTVQLDRQGAYKTPKVVDEMVSVSDYPMPIRQLVVSGLGREAPTVILTNNTRISAKAVIERYAGRMTIEQRLGESIRSFHLDALSSAVPLNVDLDVVLSVLAGAVCAALRRRLSGYHSATPDTIQRRFLMTGGVITIRPDSVVVRLKRRTYSPVLRQAAIPETAVPWWGGRRLRFEYD